MDVKHLNYILTIAKHRNMTKAAEELFVTQSSLSQYLSRLEREIGTPLFLRSKGELVLTPAGELYADAARRVIQIRKELYHDIAGLNRRGHILVGVTSNFGMRMLSEIIPRFKKLYPEITIEITEVGAPALKKLLLEEAVDIGIAAVTSMSNLEDQSVLLRTEDILFAIPADHPYALEHPEDTISQNDIALRFADESFLMTRQGTAVRQITDRFFDSFMFVPKTVCELNNIAAIRRMISAGNGISFVAESCSVNRDKIRYYRTEPRMKRLNVVTTRKNWVMREPEETFYRCLTEYFKNQTEEPYFAE